MRAAPWSSRLAIAGLALAPLIVFWRGTLGQVILAPVDGLIYSFPSRLLAAQLLASGTLPLWNPYVFSGFPLFGQMQTAVLYPGNLFFYLLPPVAAMNWMMLLCYSAAALGTYAYVRAIGCTPFAAAFAGLTFGLGGFMPAHLGHVATPQGAACLGWLLWSLERLRTTARFRFVLAAVLVVAVAICAGHPPTPIYLLMVGGLYVACFGLLERPPVGRLRYVGLSAAAVAAALLLTAVQLLPTAELAAQGERAELTFGAFASFSMPRLQLPMLLFPYFFGGGQSGTYWGAWNPGELTGYVGAAPLMLAAAALALVRRDRRAAFWAALAAFALVLVLGDGTPLARLMYQVPVYRLFRAQARNLLEFDFAVAVLAALALSAAPARALRRGAALVVAVAVLFAIVAVAAGPAIWGAFAVHTRGAEHGPQLVAAASTWNNPALLVPLAATAAAAAAVVALAHRPTATGAALLLAVQALDLFVFNTLMRHPNTAAATVLEEPPHVRALRAVQGSGSVGRVTVTAAGELTADYRHALWGVELVNGYDPFMLSRYSEFALGMPYWGNLSLPVLARTPRVLDLLSSRYLVVLQQGSPDGWGIYRILPPGGRIDFVLRAPHVADGVEAVTYLGHAVGVEQGAPVARVTLSDASGESEVLTLRAGEHTAEWSWSHPSVSSRARHARPADVVSGSTPPGGEAYRAVLKASRPLAVTRVSVESLRPHSTLAVDRLALTGAKGPPRSLTTLDAMRADTARWVARHETPWFSLLENRAALPRAWLVGRTTVLPAADVLGAVHQGRLPDGRAFDPRAEALVESGEAREHGPLGPDARVTVVAAEPNAMDLASHAATPSFLVVSEIFYPGWRAFVDDTEVPIVRTNYVLRGIELSPGSHRIRMEFDPGSVRLGAAISAATAVLLVAVGVWRLRRRQQPAPRESL